MKGAFEENLGRIAGKSYQRWYLREWATGFFVLSAGRSGRFPRRRAARKVSGDCRITAMILVAEGPRTFLKARRSYCAWISRLISAVPYRLSIGRCISTAALPDGDNAAADPAGMSGARGIGEAQPAAKESFGIRVQQTNV